MAYVFSRLVREVGDWSRHNFGDQKGAGALAPLAGIVEEIGELHIAESLDDVVDAYVDMTVFLADVCSRCGVRVFNPLTGPEINSDVFDPSYTLGKLSHAVLKFHQGIRGAGPDDIRKAAKTLLYEIIDGYYHDYAERTGAPHKKIPHFCDQVERIWSKVKQRDWKKWPGTGRPPTPVTEEMSKDEAACCAKPPEPIKYTQCTNTAIVSIGGIATDFDRTFFEVAARATEDVAVNGAGAESVFSTQRISEWGKEFIANSAVFDQIITRPVQERRVPCRPKNDLRSPTSQDVFQKVCEYHKRAKVYVKDRAEFKTQVLYNRARSVLSRCPALSTFPLYQGSGDLLGNQVFNYDCYGYYK